MTYQRKTPPKPEGYEEAMILDFKAGKTLSEIGQAHGVSRQRVHQIMKKHSVSSEGNGAKLRVLNKKQEAANARAARVMEKWGMSVEEYKAHVAEHGSMTNPDSPMGKYCAQRHRCKQLGVQWLFTFKSWWDIWQASGKWDNRGRAQYVMGRNGDATSPMGPNTCRITTVADIITGDFFVRRKVGPKTQELMAA